MGVFVIVGVLVIVGVEETGAEGEVEVVGCEHVRLPGGVVDGLDELFAEAIADGRGTTIEKVNADFGQGATLLADEAVKRGMIDSIAGSPLQSVKTPAAASRKPKKEVKKEKKARKKKKAKKRK